MRDDEPEVDEHGDILFEMRGSNQPCTEDWCPYEAIGWFKGKPYCRKHKPENA